jgi:hypothetical protein
MMEMVKGYTADAYHIDIEYEFCEQAQGDSEMESVLNVTGRVPFGTAEKTIDGTAVAAKTTSTAVAPVPAISSVGGAIVPTVPTAKTVPQGVSAPRVAPANLSARISATTMTA